MENTTTSTAQQRIAVLTLACAAMATAKFTAGDIHEAVKDDPLFKGENSRTTVGNYLRKVNGLTLVGTAAKPAGTKGKPANEYIYQAPAA